MYKLRRAIARLLTLLILPTVIYIMAELNDPEYTPSIGWALGTLAMLGASAWGGYYSELFFTFVRKERRR